MYSKTVRKTPKKFHSGTILSFFLCKSTTFFLQKPNIDSEWVIPNNEWIKKISELLQMTPLTILKFLLTIKISYFSFSRMWKFCDIMTWKGNSPHMNKFSSSCFSATSPAIRMPSWVHDWPQLDNEVSTRFQ